MEQLAHDDVRDSAADALAKIRDPAAGDALASYFTRETLPGTRGMLAAALGAVGHRAAIPDLIAALADASPGVRGAAAWSLEHLRATRKLAPRKPVGRKSRVAQNTGTTGTHVSPLTHGVLTGERRGRSPGERTASARPSGCAGFQPHGASTRRRGQQAASIRWPSPGRSC